MTIGGFGALAFLACLLAPLVGSTTIHLSRVFDRSIPFADNVDAQIFFVARLPRVLAAALVGSGLAVAGVVFQALLRNPLASPDTLGVSAGAALGAMLAITFHADFSLLSVSAVPLASFAGSLGALAIVYGLSAARGVDVTRAERVALVSASLSTGAAVSLGGPVAFVGIIVPHLVRLIVGADHRLVLPASALFGAAFLIGCDLVARTALAPVELPVGIVTAIIGGPFFLWLLFRKA